MIVLSHLLSLYRACIPLATVGAFVRRRDYEVRATQLAMQH